MKKFLRNNLQQKDIVSITVSESNASTFVFDGEEEFTYNGSMYDVVHKEKKEGFTIYYCIDDKNETALVQSFLKHQTGDKTATSKMLLASQFLSEIFIPSNQFALLNVAQPVIRHQAYCLCNYPNSYLTILKPPPQLLG